MLRSPRDLSALLKYNHPTDYSPHLSFSFSQHPFPDTAIYSRYLVYSLNILPFMDLTETPDHKPLHCIRHNLTFFPKPSLSLLFHHSVCLLCTKHYGLSSKGTDLYTNCPWSCILIIQNQNLRITNTHLDSYNITEHLPIEKEPPNY